MAQKATVAPTQQKKIARLPDVKSITGMSRSAIYSRVKEGTFPKPINLGGRSIGWIESEIQSWIDERIELANAQ